MSPLLAALVRSDGLKRNGFAPKQKLAGSQQHGVREQLRELLHVEVGIQEPAREAVYGSCGLRFQLDATTSDAFFVGRPGSIDDVGRDGARKNQVAVPYPLLAHLRVSFRQDASRKLRLDERKRLRAIKPWRRARL